MTYAIQHVSCYLLSAGLLTRIAATAEISAAQSVELPHDTVFLLQTGQVLADNLQTGLQFTCRFKPLTL